MFQETGPRVQCTSPNSKNIPSKNQCPGCRKNPHKLIRRPKPDRKQAEAATATSQNTNGQQTHGQSTFLVTRQMTCDQRSCSPHSRQGACRRSRHQGYRVLGPEDSSPCRATPRLVGADGDTRSQRPTQARTRGYLYGGALPAGSSISVPPSYPWIQPTWIENCSISY